MKNKFEVSYLNRDELTVGFSPDFDNNLFSNKSFHQSTFWGDFQESCNVKCFYLQIKNNNSVVSKILLIEKSFIGSIIKYWYIPRGPLFEDSIGLESAKDLFLALVNFAKNKNIVFIRMEPSPHILSSFNFVEKTIDIQPARTLFLDLKKEIPVLLSEMKSKTRYNIKVAQKKGVEVVEVINSEEAFLNFTKIMKETAARDGFSLHDNEYYRKLISFDCRYIKVFEARFEGEVLASGIFSFFGNTVTYIHGASSNRLRNFMSPYLLHFEIIKRAKEDAYSFYDFYGVDDVKWPGVSRFKRGFGGKEFVYPGTFDWPLKKGLYSVYKFFRFLRRLF